MYGTSSVSAEVSEEPRASEPPKPTRGGAWAVLYRVMTVGVLIGACDRYPSEALPNTSDVRVKDIIDVQREGNANAIQVGTTEVATVVARIPANATSTVVTFSTSAGTFVLTGTREVKVRAETDSLDPKQRLAARITLRADTSSFAIVSAVLSDYRDTVRVQFARQ